MPLVRRLSRGQIPEEDVAVGTGRGQSPAIGSQRQTEDGQAPAAQAAELLAGGSFSNPDGAVVSS